jgi:drug/metabolite transporter (DMT)-like permease
MAPAANSAQRWKWKTPLFAAFVIFTNAFGNFFIARGMRRLPALGSPLDLIAAILTPWVGLGIALLILWLFGRMMFLSFADLSYMLPLTSLGYVLSTVLGRFFLNEQIAPQRWAGTVLIMIGTVLVGSGNPDTTPHGDRRIEKRGVKPGVKK